MQSDVNLSPLALPCTRILSVQGGAYCLPCGGWVLGFLTTYIIPISVCYYLEFRNAITVYREYNILPSHVCSITSKQPIKLSLEKIELLNKMLLHRVNPKRSTH
jgi:hypothetical protein